MLATRDVPQRPAWVRIAAIAMAGGTVGALAAIAVDDPVRVDVAGIADGQVLGSADVEAMEVAVATSGMGAADVVAMLNGSELELTRSGGRLVARPGALVREGPNELEVRVEGRFVFADLVVTRRFSAALTVPIIEVPEQRVRPSDGEPIVLRGLVDDAVALEVNGAPAPFDGGAFSVEVSPAQAAVVVRAVHANGNATQRTVAIVDDAPAAEYPETRAVHVSAEGWADPALRGRVLELATSGAINAVQLDIKDEAGTIGYRSSVPLAQTLASDRGAGPASYDARSAIAELDELGVRVIGRVVCFLDPVLAGWAWRTGHPQMVVQSAGGATPLENDYGTAAFTNFADPLVQQYMIDVSVEAAELGFDEILYDYVRRPEGDLTEMVIPGLTRSPDVEIARFVRATRDALEEYDVELGVSVFGIAATRPRQIAQDIRLLAPIVDYVSPMVYPSHWGRGEYGVDDPVRQPGMIVERSIADFDEVVAGSGAAVVPWLQAFDSGDVEYGPAEVQEQIDGATRSGATGFLLWNSGSRYDDGVLAGVGD